MDAIYLPIRPYELDPARVKELCELRLRILSEISNESLRSRVAESLVAMAQQLASKESTVLDFGTGSGKLIKLLQATWGSARLAGVDMSFISLTKVPHGTQVLLAAPGGPLPFKSSSFDIITSLFVFHFSLPTLIRQELRRILSETGFLIGNVYGTDIGSYERDMVSSGWKLCLSVAVDGAVGHRVDAWHSANVACPRSLGSCAG